MSRVAFSILGLNIYWYSLCILFGIVLAFLIIRLETKKNKMSNEQLLDIMFYTIVVGILGARLYYVIFNFGYYSKNISEIIKVWNGGLAIHGGVIAGLIFLYFYTKKKNIKLLKFTDIAVSGVILAQACGRWGNFFNQEAHGSITTLSTLKNLKLPRFIIDGMQIDGNYYYPTFFFESIWCLIGFTILMILRKNKTIGVGFLTGFYFIWYGVGRFFIEALRTDSLMLFNLKAAQIVSIIGIIIGIILIVFSRKKNKYREEELYV